MTERTHPPFTDGNGEDLWDATEQKAGTAHAAALTARGAAAGGLRYEAYLPPDMALWLLESIEQGVFNDPPEAVFVRDLPPIPICGGSC